MQSGASEQVGQVLEGSEPTASYGLDRPKSSRPRKKGTMKEATFGERRVVLRPVALSTVEPKEAARKDGRVAPIDLAHNPFRVEEVSLSMLLCRYRCLHFLEAGATTTLPLILRM